MLKPQTTCAAPTRLHQRRLRRYPLPLYVPSANRRWIRSKILRDDFEPGMLTKPLQPFLRFNMMNSKIMNSTSGDVKFQPFLRFYKDY